MDTPSRHNIIIDSKVLMNCLPARSKSKEAGLENILVEIIEVLLLLYSINQRQETDDGRLGRWRWEQLPGGIL